jgi:hypothetical protein
MDEGITRRYRVLSGPGHQTVAQRVIPVGKWRYC